MLVAVIDTLRGLLPLAAEAEPDDTATEPYRVDPNRLYVWPRRVAPQQLNLEAAEEGFFDDSDFRVRILLTLPSKGEPRAKMAQRSLSVALDGWLTDVIAALWRFSVYPIGSGTLWHHLIIEDIRADFVRTVAARGHAIDVVLKLSAGALAAGGDSGGSGGGS